MPRLFECNDPFADDAPVVNAFGSYLLNEVIAYGGIAQSFAAVNAFGSSEHIWVRAAYSFGIAMSNLWDCHDLIIEIAERGRDMRFKGRWTAGWVYDGGNYKLPATVGVVSRGILLFFEQEADAMIAKLLISN